MHRVALVAVLMGFLAASATFSFVNPLFEAPDELWHFLYVENLKTTHTLPIAGPDKPGLNPHQEATQPPLYYVIAAVLTATLDAEDLPTALQFNPAYNPSNRDDPRAWGFLVHTEKENPRYSHFSRAAHVDRLLSVILGVGTVLFTFLLGRLVFPGRASVAIGAAATTAFNPQFVFLSASINNDTAVVFFSSVSLLLLARLLTDDANSHGKTTYLLLGLAIGLAALSKLSGLGLLLPTVLTLAYLHFWGRRRGLLTTGLLPCSVGFGVVAGWWYARNLFVYGDPLAVQPMMELTAQRGRSVVTAIGEVGELFSSYWLSFGWSTVKADPPVYVGFGLFCLAAILGVIRGLARRQTFHREASGPGLLLLLTWIGTMAALMLKWMTSAEAPQGRLLFPAMPAISLLLSWGIANLWLRRQAWLLGASSLTMLAATVVSLFVYITPLFPVWPLYPAAAAPVPTRESRVVFGDAVGLVGVIAREQEVSPGGQVAVDLLWRVTREMDRRLTGYAHLVTVGSRRNIGGASDQILGRERFPMAWWKPGDVMRDSRSIQVAANVEAPTLAELAVGVYDTDTRTPLEAVDDGNRGSPYAAALRVRVRSPQSPDLKDATASGQVFGGQIVLAAFSHPTAIQRSDGGVRGRLWWKAAKPVDRDLTVFVHLSDGSRLVGQYDAQPRGGDYPTSVWPVGDVITDTFFVPLQNVPAGRYTVVVGWYDLTTGQRLQVGQEDSLELGSVELPGN